MRPFMLFKAKQLGVGLQFLLNLFTESAPRPIQYISRNVRLIVCLSVCVIGQLPGNILLLEKNMLNTC